MKMTEKAKEVVRLSWGTLMQGCLILATVLLSFAYVKARSDMNTRDIAEHKVDDKERWTKNDEDLDDIRNDLDRFEVVQTEIRISQKEQATHYAHIISEVEELKQIVKSGFRQFEVVE
jgi:hypothetical protein